MRGLVAEAGRIRFASDLPEPAPGDGETLVEVRLAGVCATDLALVRGYMDFRGVPGHEFVGVALDGPLAGRRVVGEINAGCGRCPRCASGDPRHCPGRSVLGILGRPGAFAERLVLPTANLHPVPDGVSDEAATFAEPLAAAFEVAEQLDLREFGRALVLGDGRLGLLCAQVLARAGLAVDLAGRHPERASFLPDGVRYLPASPTPADPGGRVHELVVEATGRPELLEVALALVAPRGTVVLKTTSEARVPLDLAPLVVDEVRLVGSRCGPFAPALEALAEGSVRVEPMVAARFPLELGAEALAEAARPGTLKVLLEVG